MTFIVLYNYDDMCYDEWLNCQVRLQAELNILREQLEREKQKAVEEEERKEVVTREELEGTKQVRNITYCDIIIIPIYGVVSSVV